jgi:hypothetical protein
VDDDRKARAKNIPVYYKSIQQKPDGQARTIWEVPSQTNRSTNYGVTVDIHVPLMGGLFGVAKGKWQPKVFSEALSNADVKVHCTCPDFKWSGMTYNLGQYGKLKGSLAPVGATDDIPPDIKDPDRKHILCKHLYSVFTVFPNNAFSIMSQARKMDVEVKTDEKMTRDIDDGKLPLKKDVKTVTEDIAEPIIMSLTQAAEDINKGKEEGSQELIDEKKSIDVTETETDVDEIIDENNIKASKPETIPDISEEKDASDIIDEKNEVSIEDEEDNDVDDLIDEKNQQSLSA